MVYSKPLNILVVLALFLFDKGFTQSASWYLLKATEDTLPTGIATVDSNSPYITADDGSSLDPYVSCYSASLDGAQTWSLTTDTSSLITPSEYAFGFWVSFEKTISDKIFQFGSDTGAHYIVSSTKDGTLKVSYFSDATTTNTKSIAGRLIFIISHRLLVNLSQSYLHFVISSLKSKRSFSKIISLSWVP
ncbi:unnamed protein product [Blepharisma stoltei]|uniref:Uncharacterized protein n=1 Tax=Blepharisma stoltei TaxID=1481888 RepID=A0AAU9KGD3_9CILI|nr:unnamed protein product [Blepharisma stoltei]